ncbi:LytR/AlgR family response regulator transcription factor [Spirosoma koreense]
MNPSLPAHTLRMYIQKTGKITLPLTDLMFLQSEGNYSWLHWKDGQRLFVARTLKYYVPQLPSEMFVRAHRNCILNVHYIERMEQTAPDQGGLVYMRSGNVLPVSRRRWVAVKRMLKRLLLTDHYPQSGVA